MDRMLDGRVSNPSVPRNSGQDFPLPVTGTPETSFIDVIARSSFITASVCVIVRTRYTTFLPVRDACSRVAARETMVLPVPVPDSITTWRPSSRNVRMSVMMSIWQPRGS